MTMHLCAISPAVPVDVDLTPVAAAAAKAPRSTRQARRGDKQPACVFRSIVNTD